MSESVPGSIRLRSAGFGVLLAGVILAPLSLVTPALVATGVLVIVAVAAGTVGRHLGTWWLQLWLGVGAVGAIGVIESTTAVGLGLTPIELSAFALIFGIVDVVAGTLIYRFRNRAVSRSE